MVPKQTSTGVGFKLQWVQFNTKRVVRMIFFFFFVKDKFMSDPDHPFFHNFEKNKKEQEGKIRNSG